MSNINTYWLAAFLAGTCLPDGAASTNGVPDVTNTVLGVLQLPPEKPSELSTSAPPFGAAMVTNTTYLQRQERRNQEKHTGAVNNTSVQVLSKGVKQFAGDDANVDYTVQDDGSKGVAISASTLGHVLGNGNGEKHNGLDVSLRVAPTDENYDDLEATEVGISRGGLSIIKSTDTENNETRVQWGKEW